MKAVNKNLKTVKFLKVFLTRNNLVVTLWSGNEIIVKENTKRGH